MLVSVCKVQNMFFVSVDGVKAKINWCSIATCGNGTHTTFCSILNRSESWSIEWVEVVWNY